MNRTDETERELVERIYNLLDAAIEPQEFAEAKATAVALVAAAMRKREEASYNRGLKDESRARELAEGYALERKWVADASRVEEMVNRFLGWSLPEDFNPDCGIRFEPVNPFDGHRFKPIGTNLFSATQAKAMVEYMLSTQPRAEVEASEGMTLAELRQELRVPDGMTYLMQLHPWVAEYIDRLEALALLARAPREESGRCDACSDPLGHDGGRVYHLCDVCFEEGMGGKLRAAEAELDRLREGIKAVADKWRVLYGIDYSEEMADDLDALLRAETPEPAPNPEGRTCEMRLNSPESPDSSTGFGRHICWSCLRAKGSNAHASIHNLAKTDWCYVCEHRSEGINKPAASDGKGE